METATSKRQEHGDTILALDKYDVVGFATTLFCFVGAIVSDALQADTQAWIAGIAGGVVLTLTVVDARRRAALTNSFKVEVKGAQYELKRFEAVSKKLEAADAAEETVTKKRRPDAPA